MLPSDKKIRALTLRLTPADRRLLDKLARLTDRSAGSVLRQAMREYAQARGIHVKGVEEPGPA